MILLILIVGVVLIVVAVRNSQGSLFAAFKTDLPKFAVWAAAIIAIGLIGAVPGLKPISRGLLILIFLVIILNNYQKIISSFQGAWQGASKAGADNSAAPSNAASTAKSFLSGASDVANAFGGL